MSEKHRELSETKSKLYPEPDTNDRPMGAQSTNLDLVEKKIIKPIIEIEKLIIAPEPMKVMCLGNLDSLRTIVTNMQKHIGAIFWCETEISLMVNSSNERIFFKPEFKDATAMFFQKDNRRTRDEEGIKIWSGEFAPVQFTKRDLIKFLTKYSEFFDSSIIDAMKSLKITTKTESESTVINLDNDSERNVDEYQESTNIPSKFSASMPIFDDQKIKLEFEAKIAKRLDEYGRTKGQNMIEVRCTNAREALRECMQTVIQSFPNEIPKYYGKFEIEQAKR